TPPACSDLVVGELEANRRGVDDAGHLGGGALRFDGARLFVDALGDALDVPHQADGGHRPDDVPGRIEFPPVEAVARGALVAVVVVVPAFANGEHGGHDVVP